VRSDHDEELLFLAGQLVPRGVYVRVDAWPERRDVLEHSDVLPASLDGQVACYRLLPDAAPAGSRLEASKGSGEARGHRTVPA
jgi:hypothetical protein